MPWHATLVVTLLLLLLGVASAHPQITPIDTDCLNWLPVSDLGPGKVPPGKLLMTGHQTPCPKKGIPGVWGELLCMTLDGKEGGHFDYSNPGGMADPSAPTYDCPANGICFTFGSGEFGPWQHSFFLATYAKENLTWTSYAAGAPVPTNAVTVGSWLVARRSVTRHSSNYPPPPPASLAALLSTTKSYV
jgi:hypothetical protein